MSKYGHAHRVARVSVLDGDPLCVHCMTEVATVADHQPPLALHEHIEGSGCCTYVPSCRACSYKQAGEVANLVAGSPVVPDLEVIFAEPDAAPAPSAPCWRVPWLIDLLDVPESATWPRFMSAPHPNAVGSYGVEFERHTFERSGQRLRWWQRLVARRLLEHDDDGTLCWLTVLVSTARQVGKTHLIVELLMFALVHVRRFWLADDVMICSRRLISAEGATKNVLRWAHGQPDYTRTATNGQKRIAYLDQFELLVRSIDSAYSETLGMCVVDEAWDADPAQYAEAVEPTTTESGGMLLVTSTAHRKATSVCLNLRAEAFESDQGDEPEVLLIEWSARGDLADDSIEAWRQASPHWTKHRERRIARAYKRAIGGETIDETEPDPMHAFRAQFLNRWPIRQTKRGPGEPLFEAGAWSSALHTTERPELDRVVAIEDNYGYGLAVAVAGISPAERVAVTARTFDDALDGWAHALDVADGAVEVLVGATLLLRPETHDLGTVSGRGTQQLKSGLSILRTLIEAQDLVHDGEHDLAEQVIECRLRQTSTGLVIASKRRHDAVSAMTWAVAEVQRRRTPQGAVL